MKKDYRIIITLNGQSSYQSIVPIMTGSTQYHVLKNSTGSDDQNTIEDLRIKKTVMKNSLTRFAKFVTTAFDEANNTDLTTQLERIEQMYKVQYKEIQDEIDRVVEAEIIVEEEKRDKFEKEYFYNVSKTKCMFNQGVNMDATPSKELIIDRLSSITLMSVIL